MPQTQKYFDVKGDSNSLKQLQMLHTHDAYFAALAGTGGIQQLAETLLGGGSFKLAAPRCRTAICCRSEYLRHTLRHTLPDTRCGTLCGTFCCTWTHGRITLTSLRMLTAPPTRARTACACTLALAWACTARRCAGEPAKLENIQYFNKPPKTSK